MSTQDEHKPGYESEDEVGGGSVPEESRPGRRYEICVGAQLDASWSEWFEGLEMRPCGENRTILSGRVADQAALLGILNKVSRLNLPLVSVNEIRGDDHQPETIPEGGE